MIHNVLEKGMSASQTLDEMKVSSHLKLEMKFQQSLQTCQNHSQKAN
jgi:hypothetical protein